MSDGCPEGDGQLRGLSSFETFLRSRISKKVYNKTPVMQSF